MDETKHLLQVTDGRLTLLSSEHADMKPLYVDFRTATMDYRRRKGGGKSQMIARAVGIRQGFRPHVVDATAGLGFDAFVLAALGCRVHMIERSALIGPLLKDGLKRAAGDREIGLWISERLSLDCRDAREALRDLPFMPDTIYLDPMFPQKRKTALVKKEMQILKEVLGNDEDAHELLPLALSHAQRRVVVKRPLLAPTLDEQKPSTVMKGKANRFDIYLVS